MGIEVLPPDINQGGSTFKVAAEGKIHFGLGAIKGVGFKAVEAIVAARAGGGPFHGLDDLFERVPSGSSARLRRGLDQGRGVRQPGRHSASQWLAVLPRAAPGRAGGAGRPQRGQRALRLFDRPGPPTAMATARVTAHRQRPRLALSLPDVPELPDAERLAEEKKVLGFYMSSHPLTRHAGLLQAPGDAPRGRAGRRRREDRGRPGRDDRQRPDQERAEEPLGPDPDGQAHLRGPQRLDARDALARGVRQAGGPGQERPDRLRPGDARPPPRPAPSWSSAGSSRSTRGRPS